MGEERRGWFANYTVGLIRLERRPLRVSSSKLTEALSLAGRAALTFWLTFVLAAAALSVFDFARGASSHDWGPSVQFVITMLWSTILGVVAALSHGVAVFILPGTYSAMDSTRRRASSAVTAIGVLLAASLVLPLLGIPGKAVQTPFILSWVTLPLGLSISFIAAVSLLPGTRAAVGVAPTSQVTRFRDALLLVASLTILVAGTWVFVRRQSALCDNSLVSRLPSPDGVHEAVVYSQDCGAPTDVSTHVTVLTAGAQVPSRWGSTAPSVTPPDTGSPVLVIDSNHGAAPARFPGEGPAVDATWVARDSLLVRFDSRARVLRQESTAGGVGIRYASVERGGPRQRKTPSLKDNGDRSKGDEVLCAGVHELSFNDRAPCGRVARGLSAIR